MLLAVRILQAFGCSVCRYATGKNAGWVQIVSIHVSVYFYSYSWLLGGCIKQLSLSDPIHSNSGYTRNS